MSNNKDYFKMTLGELLIEEKRLKKYQDIIKATFIVSIVLAIFMIAFKKLNFFLFLSPLISSIAFYHSRHTLKIIQAQIKNKHK